MDYTLVYYGIAFFVLCLILDEVFAWTKYPPYFKQIVFLYNKEMQISKFHEKLPSVEELHYGISARIKNKYRFFVNSHKEIFYKEFQFDYGVSRYSVIPIHGAIELVSPQKVKVSVCLNLSIIGISFLIYMLFAIRLSAGVALTFIAIYSLVVSLWFYFRIKTRFKTLLRSIEEWLGN